MKSTRKIQQRAELDLQSNEHIVTSHVDKERLLILIIRTRERLASGSRSER